MEALVGLDDVAVERRRDPVSGPLAELDELPVLDHGDRLAGELSGRHPLHRRPERVQVIEERAIPLGDRIETVRVEAQLAQPLGDHPVVLGLVARLAGQGHLHRDLVRADEPARRDLGRLDLVLQRDLEEIEDVEVARDLGRERRLGLESPEHGLVLLVQLPHEFLCRHAAIPSFSIVPSSCVSVSRVTTRAQRECRGWVWRASAWVVKPRVGGRGVWPSSFAKNAS